MPGDAPCCARHFGFHQSLCLWNLGLGMMGPGMMYGYGGGWYMGIMMILFWGLIIWGVIALIRYFGGNRQINNQGSSALEILKRRYAQGEVNRDEYEEKKRTLV
jgi:putative membrane protein